MNVQANQLLDAAAEQTPRLSIMHLMTGTTCVALMFAWMQRFPDPFWEALLTQPILYNSLFALTDGIAITGIIWIFWRSPKPRRYLSHPGYFLIVVFGIMILINKGTLTFAELFFGQDATAGGTGAPIWNTDPNYELVTSIGWTVASLITSTLMMVATFRKGNWTVAWRLLFFVLALFHFTFAIQYMGFQFFANNNTSSFLDWVETKDAVFLVTIGLIGLLAIGIDIWNKNWRDWLHWIGVLVFIQMSFGARYLFYLFFDPDRFSGSF